MPKPFEMFSPQTATIVPTHHFPFVLFLVTNGLGDMEGIYNLQAMSPNQMNHEVKALTKQMALQSSSLEWKENRPSTSLQGLKTKAEAPLTNIEEANEELLL